MKTGATAGEDGEVDYGVENGKTKISFGEDSGSDTAVQKPAEMCNKRVAERKDGKYPSEKLNRCLQQFELQSFAIQKFKQWRTELFLVSDVKPEQN